ncbi:MAG: TetR/AcrR family transcriptional regulator [Actinomycetota bacterium]|nr:TetR/AcrR family transcriptional regulator [Actinomycetota bacterium]
MTKRDEQRQATRRRIVETAVELLVSSGVAATTSSAVQRKAGMSRGALLHHFPTHEALLAATVRRLVEINEETAKKVALARLPTDDAVTVAIRTLRQVVESPHFAAELSLWAAASTDPVLCEVLRREEAASRRDLYRVVDEVFGTELAARPQYPAAAALTVVFLRGLALSRALASARGADRLTEEWAGVIRAMLEDGRTEPPVGGRAETGGRDSG